MESASTRAAPPKSYVIQGRTVTMPCMVRDASSAVATWLVSARAAQRLLPGRELKVAEVLPGRGLLSIACVDYRDNDLGDYHELSIALFVRPRGVSLGVPYLGTAIDMIRGRLATHILHLPVNQSFTCEAGRTIWGFPKTVDQVDFYTSGDRAICIWNKHGHNVLRISMPIGGHKEFPEQTMCTYSYIEGALHRNDFTSSAEGVGVKLGGVDLELGAHPIADELRSLGLPKPALMSMWLGRMTGRFEAPEKQLNRRGRTARRFASAR